MTTDAERSLIDTLLAIRAGAMADRVLAERLRANFVSVGSSTPDNELCVERLDVQSVSRPAHPNRARGITLRDRPTLVADVISAAEGGGIPPSVQRAYPELTEQEWNACLRLVTVVMTLFENPM